MTIICQTIDEKQRNLWGSRVFALILGSSLAWSPNFAAADTITAFAASSLRDAITEIAAEYESATGEEVVLVFAASSVIARQVARGAPGDVVLLADQDWADWLVDQGTLDYAGAFAGNKLVIMAPIGTAPLADISTLGAALGDGVLAMAQVQSVPAGRYGKAALTSLGVWGEVSDRVVQAPNVRAGLRFVERAEAPFGIGYASDLVALPTLTAVYEFEADTHPDIVYSGGAITTQGTAFMDFIQSPIGRAALLDWGFSTPPMGQ